MKLIIDLIHRLHSSYAGLQNGQPETIATASRVPLQLCQTLKSTIILLALIIGWGGSAVADTEVDVYNGSINNYTVIPASDFSTALQSKKDNSVLRIYMDHDNGIGAFRTSWGNTALFVSGATSIAPNSGYYISNSYQIPFTDLISTFQQVISTEQGFAIQPTSGVITRISVYTPSGSTDPFINNTSPDAKGNGTKEVAVDTTHPSWESFSLAELTTNNTGATAFSTLGDIKYIRVYVKEGNSAVDYNSHVNGQTTDLLQVTAGTGVTVAPAAAAGKTADPKNGLNVYKGGNALTLSDISVTLNAGEGNLKDYKIIVLLSTSTLTNEGNEPTWDFEYTYNFTYPIKNIYIAGDETNAFPLASLSQSRYEFNIISNIMQEFGVSNQSDLDGRWAGKWYVLDKQGNPQTLTQSDNPVDNLWATRLAWDGGSWQLVDGNTAYQANWTNSDYYFRDSRVGKIRFDVPKNHTFEDYVGYEIIFDFTAEYLSGEPAYTHRFHIPIPSTSVFEFDGTPGATANVSQTLASRTATSVTLDWTNMTTTGVKYARFFVVDSNGDPVDATGLLTVSGGMLCTNPASGYYVYNSGNDITMPTVTLSASSTTALLGYRVKCWLATSTTGIALDGTTVTEEPDITNEYVYSFVKPAPTIVNKTGDIAWGASMQADATDGAPADWGTTWDELSQEQRVVWYVTDGTTKQALALGTAAQSGTWVLNLPTDKFSVSSNEAVLTGQTTFTATEWNTWGKPALYAPSGVAYATVHGYKVVCEVYESATGTTPNVRYTFSFTKDFLGSEKSGITTSTETETLASATEVSCTISNVNIPANTKYARIYLTDASGNMVDPMGMLSVTDVTTATVSNHPEYGYYIYNNGSSITAPTAVTLTLTTATLNEYKVVMVTSADNAVTESGAVVNEPDWDTQTTWSFKYPVQHTEKTGEVEWSPVSMYVELDINALKGITGYKEALSGNYHVVWTVEDGSGTAQALTTGYSRQANTWTYSVDDDNATFYAPSGQTFADMGNIRFVARLYETATGENSDLSLTYTVSIYRTNFLGQLKSGVTEVRYTVDIINTEATSVEVPLDQAISSFGQTAKYARIWVTQNDNPINPTIVFPVTDATPFSQDATYGYYLSNSSGVSLSATDLTASELNTYEVHVALSVDEPVSTTNFSRGNNPRRVESLTEYEPDYDYLYTIAFQYSGGVVKHKYIQWDTNYTTINLSSWLQGDIPELNNSSTDGFIRWSILDGNSNPIAVDANRYNNNSSNWSFTGNDSQIFGPYENQGTSFAISGSQIQNYWTAFTNTRVYAPYGHTFADYPNYTVVCEVSDESNPTNSDIKVTYIIHFNKDGLEPYTFLNETSVAETKQLVNVGTLSASSPTFDMTDALVSGAQYARIYLAKYGNANDASSDLLVTYNGEAATACVDPYGKYGWYISDANGIDLDELIVGSTTLTADDMLKYNLVVVSSTNALSGDQEPSWEQKTVYSFQKEIRERIYADNRNYIDAINKQSDILSRLGASSVADFSKSLYAKWYIENPAGEKQVIAGGSGSWDYKWYFEIANSGVENWQVVGGKELNFYTDQDANSTYNKIEDDQWGNLGIWSRLIGLTMKIHVSQTENPPTATTMTYVGWRVVFEISDEYDTDTEGADPGYRLRYVFTITDPAAFTGIQNTGGVDVSVTQTVNRTAESINLTLQDNNNNTTWAFEHNKLTRWEWQQQTTWPYMWQRVQVQTPLRYARFYLTDTEGNEVDPTGKLTVTYGGDNATVTACTTPEHGFYIFGEGGTTINRNQVTVSLAAPKEYKLYKVVCLFSTALDGIVPEDLTTPLQREPDYDLKYTYSFDYPRPTTKVINITIPWSKTGMRLRANTDADGNLLTDSSVDDAWGITFPELSAGQYVRWYVQRQQGNNSQRQQLVSGSERTRDFWALNAASVYNFLDGPNQQGGDQAYLTGRTDFTEANWNNVWSSPTIYAPTNFNPGPAELNECRFICEVYADDDDSGTPYVRYIFTMEKFLGDLKDTGAEGEETILLDRNTTTYDVPLDDIYEALNIPAYAPNVPKSKIVYARVWLTKSDGTPVLPNGLSWTQMYDGHNQAQVLPGNREVYGWYFCSADIGTHHDGMTHGELASDPNSCTLTLPAGTYSQYQVHVALSTNNPSGMRWDEVDSRWEYANGNVGLNEVNALPGQPAEPDFDYEFTIKFDYGFEAPNINTVKTKYKTAIYDETTRKFTPRLFQNWLEVAADCDVQRQELADKAYARWYLEDLEGNLIQIEELTSPKPYTSLGNPYGFYRYKFDVNDFNDTKGLTDNGYNPTITLPGGYTYNQVRLVCVVTTLTEPQAEPNQNLPKDIPAWEPAELQVKYVYSLVKASDFTDLPFVHYQGEAYKWLVQMGRTDEATADRDYIIEEGTAGAIEKSWDFENSEMSEETFGNIRQNVHTVDYYVYFDPSDAQDKSLMLPSQYYFGGYNPFGEWEEGNDTEPRAYYRWYDYKTDVKASCLTAYGSQLHLYPNAPDVTEEKAGDPSRGFFAMLLNSTGSLNPYDGNIGVRFNAPAGWNAGSDEILVACDVSRYLDGMDDSFTYLIHEPTLSVRYLFHILPAQKIASDIAAAATTTIDGTTYTGLAAVEQNLLAGEDTELYEYNGRTVVSLNGTSGMFTLRSDLQQLSSYWVYANNSLVNCSNFQWYAYYLDDQGQLWKHTINMGERAANRLGIYYSNFDETLDDYNIVHKDDFSGIYYNVSTNESKEITVQPDTRLYMIGCMGDGTVEVPVVWNELNFIDAKPLLIGTEGTVPERTDQYMRSEYTLAQVLDFNDFFDVDERFNKPTASYENYAKVPIIWPDAQYGFCYPQLYGLCGTNKYAGWGVYGISPTHGDYTLLKSMNMPGVSVDENFTEQSIGSQWWWNTPLYDVTHTRAANGNTATDTNDYGTFLYVDASDEARVIAELEFDAALCADAEIYYTAYVADMTNNITRPQVRFRVSTEVDGKRVPVVTFETGNIVSEIYEPGVNTVKDGYKTGFWHQVYGYTVLPGRLHNILDGTTRHYYVSVENSCENTNGADYCVDQISFYTHQASVKAKIVSDICDDGPVKVKIVAEAEQLLNSLRDLSPSGTVTKDVFYCIAERYADLNHELHAEDILTGNGFYTDQNNNPNNEYGVVSVPLDLDLLTNATELHDGTKANSGFYYDADDDMVYFQLDEREFDLESGKKYFVSIYDMAENRVGGLDGWGTPYSGNACSVYSNDLSPNRMYVDLTVDGQSTDGHIEFGCNTTEVTKRFDIAINYPSGDGYDRYTYFKYDYFELAEGKTITDFKNIKDEGNNIYLTDAIDVFREWMRYDQAGRPEEEKDYAVPGTVYTELPRPVEDDTEHMAMYNLIKKYMDGFEGAEGKLYLSATSGIERTFNNDGIYKYLAIPLTKEVPTGGEVCSPIEFEFNVDAAYGGPEILLGFDDVAYPDGYTRVIRAGLEQLNKMKSESYMLHIPISSYHNKGQGMGARIYFQNTNLYLYKTNDPTIETNPEGVPTSTTPIKVAEIKVPEDATGTAYVGPDRMYLPVDFSQGEVTFHEGYWYEVNTSFIDETDLSETDPCVGDLSFILKVVPEFATWVAQPIEENTTFYNANWYNDANWQRSVRADLYKDDIDSRNQNTSTLGHPDGYQDDSEIAAALTGNPGFVPMKFTYVTFLTGNHAPSLIKEPKVSTSSSQQGGGLLDPNQTRMLTDPSPYTNQVSSQPTDNIRYDMLVRYGAHSEGGEGCFGHRLMTMNQAGKYIWGNDPRSEEQMSQFNTDRKAFDVEKFYGNICREVYFKPGAELLRQQRLSYNRAWVEKQLVPNKWYLVSSPLKDTYAGDMYVPVTMTDVSLETPAEVKGRQATEAFQPISFNTAAVSADADHTVTSQPAYSRTKYPIYQRSWNTEGAKVYTKTNDARATDYSANLGYESVSSVDVEWSHTYNDVQVPYTTLTGFSIRPHKKDQTDNTLIRLPKADTQYDYYQWDNISPADGKLTHEVSRSATAPTSYPLPSRYPNGITNNYRLVVDDPEADGLLTVNISDLQQQDGYILVGNPHMASLRMDEFFRLNPGLAPSYWTYEGSVASAALAAPETITATGDDNADGIIRPLQAFFVKKKTELAEGETEATTITFTRSMTIDGNFPALPSVGDGGGSRQTGLMLSARSEAGGSSAVVRLSDTASNEYREGEDVETLFDSNLSGVPMVFTIADGQAVSIDQRPQLDVVPFGVTCSSSEPVEVQVTSHLSPLTSHLSSPTSHLYIIDALTGEQTEVEEGSTVSVQPNDYGRYFISTKAIETNAEEEQSLIISVRQQEVTVTATSPLSLVRAITLDGKAAFTGSGLSTQCHFLLAKGVYIIQAHTTGGIQRRLKVVVE